MSTAALPPLSSDGSPAERIYLEWTLVSHADKTGEFELLCAAHALLASELREIHAKLEGIDALLAQGNLAVNTPQQLTEQLRSDDPPFEELIAALRAKTPKDRYRTVGVLGEGGMGKVYEVEDLVLHVRRAKKVVLERKSWRGGLHVDAHLLRRFILEAETLSKLDHPGIVPILDYGVDEEERIYYVMPVVSGPTLADVLAAERSGSKEWTRTRILAELVKVCDALAYAHSLGIVHRDLKPTNIKLGEFGRLYVLDWGLSKELRVQAAAGKSSSARDELESKSPGGGRRTQLTQHGTVSGTPPYFSPEQARGEVDRIDERSDVYAIGAMLYELSSGRAPYLDSDKKLNNEALSARAIAGPPKPLLEMARAAGKRVPAELQAICEKAMARERDERYATMTRLAADLRAFLEQRVVDAFEAGSWAETRKWVVRNRGLAFALAGSILILLAGLVSTTVYAREADRQRVSAAAEAERANEQKAAALAAQAQADAARHIADQRTEETSRVANFQGYLLEVADLEPLDGVVREQIALSVRRSMTDRNLPVEQIEAALTSLAQLLNGVPMTEVARTVLERVIVDRATDAIGSQFAGDPLIQARLRHSLASTCERIGLFERGLAEVRIAYELRRTALGEEHEATLTSMGTMGALLALSGHRDEAQLMLRHELEVRRRINGDNDKATINALNNLGEFLKQSGEFEEAENLLRSALDSARRVLPEDHEDTINLLNNLGTLIFATGNPDEAKRLLREALERGRRALGPDNRLMVTVLSNLGAMLQNGRDWETAGPLLEEALERSRRVFGEDHPNTLTAGNNVAMLRRQQGHLDLAEALYRDGMVRARRTLGDDSRYTLGSENNVALLLRTRGELAEAETLFRDVYERRLRLLGPDHPSTLLSTYGLGALLSQRGALHEAEALLSRLADTMQQGRRAANLEPKAVIEELVLLYERLETAEPGSGYAEKARTAREALTASQK